MSARATQFLKQQSLRVTPARQDVLELFFQRQQGLSHGDVEAALPEYDRVTLYRTLGTLLEKSILHRVPDASGLQRFALGPDRPQHPHVHFQCMSCGTTLCLDEAPMHATPLPPGSRALHYEFLVRGLCERCNKG
jgi:Fur family ferric uptake transcriptional regulator